MKRVWLDRPGLDLLVMLPSIAFWFLAPYVQSVTPILYPSVSAVLAILAAVITFACSTVYQSKAAGVQEARLRFGRQLRRTWRVCILSAVTGSLISVAAILVSALQQNVALVMCVASAFLVAARTYRAVIWVDFVYKAEDRSLPGLPVRRRQTAA